MTGKIKTLEEGDKLKFIHAHYSLSKAITVKTAKLDSLRNDLKRPDLIKIDAEGAEERIIMGGAELIKEQQPVLILENPDHSDGFKLVSKLKTFNYDVFNAEDINEVCCKANNLLALPHHFSGKIKGEISESSYFRHSSDFK